MTWMGETQVDTVKLSSATEDVHLDKNDYWPVAL